MSGGQALLPTTNWEAINRVSYSEWQSTNAYSLVGARQGKQYKWKIKDEVLDLRLLST